MTIRPTSSWITVRTEQSHNFMRTINCPYPAHASPCVSKDESPNRRLVRRDYLYDRASPRVESSRLASYGRCYLLSRSPYRAQFTEQIEDSARTSRSERFTGCPRDERCIAISFTLYGRRLPFTAGREQSVDRCVGPGRDPGSHRVGHANYR